MAITDPELMAMFAKAMSKNIKDTDSPKDRRKMSENDKRWASADKWGQLLRLNKTWILQSQNGRFASTPYHKGPLACDDLKVMTFMGKLHRRGLLVTGGDGCSVGKASGGWFFRQVPYLDFIIRDEGNVTKTFIQTIRQHPDLVMHMTNSRGVMDGTSPLPHAVLTLLRSSPTSEWNVSESAEAPLSLEDYDLQDHPVLLKGTFLICRVFPKLSDSTLYKASDDEFIQKTQEIDIFGIMHRAAEGLRHHKVTPHVSAKRFLR